MDSRESHLRELLACSRSVPDIAKALSAYEWDSSSPLVKLTASHIYSVLSRFLSGDLSAMHVEVWANAIECREDIQYISSSLVGEVLHELANPLLTRPLTRQSAAMAIARLNLRVVDLSADVRILDIDAHLVQRQEMYFGTRGASANQIASNIAGDALVMGCTSVRVWTQDDWWLISGNVDWLNAPNHMGVNDQNAFETVWALPEAGQMHHWSTVMARVFATATATRCGENSFLVKGTPADLQQFTRVSANAPHLDRVIGFRFHVAA